MLNIIWIIIALGLVLLNAFFVAAEFGMVKLRHTRLNVISKKYGLRGQILKQVHTHLDAYLSACQVGITLASLGLGWVGEPAFAKLLKPLFSYANKQISPEMITFFSFFIAFSFISFLHIVVGELMPKSLAIRRAETVSVWTAIPLYGFYWLMYPAIWVLNTSSNFFLKLVKLDIRQDQKYYSIEELKLILSASHLHGELTNEETAIIEHTLEFADLRVTEVMRSDEDLIVVNLQDPIDKSLAIMVENRFSRYPVYDREKDKIIGVIHVKDLFSAMFKHKKIDNLKLFIRPILKINHRSSALTLLNRFRKGVSPFALVYKNKDTLLGFITFDNLLHFLIGRIKDEFHLTVEDWIRNPDGSITISGDSSIYALERALNRDITLNKDEKNINMLAGLIVTRVGELPKLGDVIEFKEFNAMIEGIEGHKIRKIKIYPKVKSSLDRF